MGRRITKQPNGRLAVYSSITDSFIVWDATPEELIEWLAIEASQEARSRAEQWLARPYSDFDDLLKTIKQIHGTPAADKYRADLSAPVEPEEPEHSIDLKPTSRGFMVGEFTDRYGVPCSIQESSLATESALWLGVADSLPQVLVPGEGWKAVDLNACFPGRELHLATRMHLTRGMARQLIPLLQHFVTSGELPHPEDPAPT